jgi:hypothetical protein
MKESRAFIASLFLLRRIVPRAFDKLAIKFGESGLRRLYPLEVRD